MLRGSSCSGSPESHGSARTKRSYVISTTAAAKDGVRTLAPPSTFFSFPLHFLFTVHRYPLYVFSVPYGFAFLAPLRFVGENLGQNDPI